MQINLGSILEERISAQRGTAERIGAELLKSYGLTGTGLEDMSLMDIFGAPGHSAIGTSALRDIEQLRGWNFTAVVAKALEFSIGNMAVYCPEWMAKAIAEKNGDEYKASKRVSGLEQYNIPEDWVVATRHHRIARLMRKPNPWLDQAAFFLQLSLQTEIHGVAHILVLPDGNGVPTQMWVIPKAAIQPLAPSAQYPEGSYRIGHLSKLSINTYDNNKEPRTMQEMLAKISNREYSGKYIIPVGLSSATFLDDFLNPSSALSDVLDTDTIIHQTRRSVLNKQMTTGPRLEPMPGVTIDNTEWVKILEEFEAQNMGPDRRGNAWRNPAGVKVTNDGHTGREMEFVKSADQSRDHMLGQRHMSPAMLGLGDGGSYAQVVGLIKGNARRVMQPLMRIYAGQLTLGLQRFFESPQSDFMTVMQCANIDDPEQRMREWGFLKDAGAVNVGEVRSAFNMMPFDDEKQNEKIAGAQEQPGGMNQFGGGEAPYGNEYDEYADETGRTDSGQPETPGIGAPEAEPETMSNLKTSAVETRSVSSTMSRREFMRHSKNIMDIVTKFKDGVFGEKTARLMLQTLGLPTESAQEFIDSVKDPLAEQAMSTAENQTTATALFSRMASIKSGSFKSLIDDQAQTAATHPGNDLRQPTETEQKAGLYRKGKVRLCGLMIEIENPVGSIRSGRRPDGSRWAVEMQDHYGYVVGAVGFDKDQLDIFIKHGTEPVFDGSVYVINQANEDGTFDEHKCFIGCDSKLDAIKRYLDNYDDDWSDRIMSVGQLSIPQFKDWMLDADGGPLTGELTPDDSLKYVTRSVVVAAEPMMVKSFTNTKSEKDGDGDGMINDGTPQEKPVGHGESENVRYGKPQWDGTDVTKIADIPNGAIDRQRMLMANSFPKLEQYASTTYNTPIRRMTKYIQKEGEKGKDYELRFIDVDKVKLTQDGEDYNNGSSQYTAETFVNVSKGKNKINEIRQEDIDPIVLDSRGFVRDGHHRHAAHRMTGSKQILALVPVEGGMSSTPQIKNVAEFHASLVKPKDASTKKSTSGGFIKAISLQVLRDAATRYDHSEKQQASNVGIVTSDELDSMSDDPQEKAELIADILTSLYGDEAEALISDADDAEKLASAFGKAFGSPGMFKETRTVRRGANRAGRDPRDADGDGRIFDGTPQERAAGVQDSEQPARRSRARNTPERIAKIHSQVEAALKGERTPKSAKALADSLSSLTVKQLHELKTKYEMKASGRTKTELVDKIAKRLDSGRRIRTEDRLGLQAREVGDRLAATPLVDDEQTRQSAEEAARLNREAAEAYALAGDTDKAEYHDDEAIAAQEIADDIKPKQDAVGPINGSIVESEDAGWSDEEIIQSCVEAGMTNQEMYGKCKEASWTNEQIASALTNTGFDDSNVVSFLADAGLSDVEIYTAVDKNGWSDVRIEDAMAEPKQESVPDPPSPPENSESRSIFDEPVGTDPTPDAVASAATEQVVDASSVDSQYEFARATSVSNAGEDLKLSKRHIANAWRTTLDSATEDQRATMLTKANLQRNEPHSLHESYDQNDGLEKAVVRAAAAICLNKFPGKVYDGTFTASLGEDARKKNQEEYVESWRILKAAAERIADESDNPQDVVLKMRAEISKRITDLRASNSRYNNHANQLVDMSRSLTTTNHKKTGTGAQIIELMKLRMQQDPADFNKAVDGVLQNKTIAASLGKKSESSGQRKPSSIYDKMTNFYNVLSAERVGGREVSVGNTPESLSKHLIENLGFRGVQHGNYVPDDERIAHMRHTANACADLLDVTGLREKDITFDGKLGIAFGARGNAGALAHYEPTTEVVALTRHGGSGALAHEWGHFFDHMCGQSYEEANGNKNPISADSPYMMSDKASGSDQYHVQVTQPDGTYKWQLTQRPQSPVRDAMKALQTAFKESGYSNRLSTEMSKARREGMSQQKLKYWRSDKEVFARTFESWVQHSLESKGRKNDYLCSLASDGGMWPTREERAKMAPAFENLMDAHRKHNLGIERQVYDEGRRTAAVEKFMKELR